jgi:glutathione synthase/RimK-type ligase-like ATP-grasp enzyme
VFDVTIATHAAMPAGSTDDRLFADALASAGARVRVAVWNDPGLDWSLSPRTVIRSTWDYHLQPDAWFAWLEAVSRHTILINDAATVRWNSDKGYLLDLAAAGVAIVPTVLVTRAHPVDLATLCGERGWRDVVVKPSIGASAKGAERFTSDAIASAGRAHLEALLANGDALIQPYQAAVQDDRERSLVYIGGVFSHAFTKPPFLRGTGDGLGEMLHGASAEERALADQALRATPGPTIYARVDLVPTPDGPRLMELELIEPDLGLRLHPPSVPALVAAIVG